MLEVRDNDGNTGLINASLNGFVEIIEILLRYNADISAKDKDGWTSLIWAIQNENISCVQLLINNCKDVRNHIINITDNYNMTPIMYAIDKTFNDIIILLLDNKYIDLKIVDSMGRSALDIANSRNIDESIIRLIQDKN